MSRRIWVAALALLVPVQLAGQARRPPATPWTPPPGDWQLPGYDYGLTRYSPLETINLQNVSQLKPVWTFSTGALRAHEGAPLIVGTTMFVHTPFPNAVFALDLGRPGAPILWSYALPAAATKTTPPTGCCDVGSRGLAYHPSGKIFVPLLTGELAALDAQTGREIWRVRNADPKLGATVASAPLVVRDVVIVGMSGSEYGARGYLTGYSAANGRLLWRAYSTGPDSDVLLENDANLQYASHRGHDLGVSTWPAGTWQHGGGTPSGWLSYDPDLDLVYYGTDEASPYNADLRTGDNKWTSTIFARKPETGHAKWAYQITPHGEWGYGAANENILADLKMGGAPVKVLVHFDRNGFAYTIDRATGKVLLAEKFGPVNWADRIDLESGVPIKAAGKTAAGGAKALGVCPAFIGQKHLQPAAFSPLTGLFYVPVNNLCMDFQTTPVTYTPGQPFLGATIKASTGPGGYRGRFIAWDAAKGTIAWEVKEPLAVASGVLTTAGGLVFYGTLEGWIKALDQKTGRELWRFKTPSGIVGSPITFAGPDGKQYVAVLSGVGGWAGLGGNGAFPDLDAITNLGGVLMVFGL
jgi:PQQ-dependent dehydrogenase (methanol/ethanol family)